MKYLLMYSGNWNDEITVDGFVILTKEIKDNIIKTLLKYQEPITISVGDLDIDYDNGKDLLDEITFNRITERESNIIEKYFGNGNDFGYNLITNIEVLNQ